MMSTLMMQKERIYFPSCALVTMFSLVIGIGSVACESAQVRVLTGMSFVNEIGMSMIALSNDIYVAKYETTNKQFRSVMNFVPCKPLNLDGKPFRDCAEERKPKWKEPVTELTALEADQFCDNLTQMERAKGRLKNGYRYTLPDYKTWRGLVADSDEKKSITGYFCRSGPLCKSGILEVDKGECNSLGICNTLGNVSEFSVEVIDKNRKRYWVLGGDIVTQGPGLKYIRRSIPVDYRSYYSGFRVVLVPVGIRGVE